MFISVPCVVIAALMRRLLTYTTMFLNVRTVGRLFFCTPNGPYIPVRNGSRRETVTCQRTGEAHLYRKAQKTPPNYTLPHEIYYRLTRYPDYVPPISPITPITPITGEHRNQDQIWLGKIREYLQGFSPVGSLLAGRIGSDRVRVLT